MMLCVIRKVEGYALHESGIVVRWQPDMSQVVAADRFQNIQMLCKDHPSELPLDQVAMSDCKISRRDIQFYVLGWRR